MFNRVKPRPLRERAIFQHEVRVFEKWVRGGKRLIAAVPLTRFSNTHRVLFVLKIVLSRKGREVRAMVFFLNHYSLFHYLLQLSIKYFQSSFNVFLNNFTKRFRLCLSCIVLCIYLFKL